MQEISRKPRDQDGRLKASSRHQQRQQLAEGQVANPNAIRDTQPNQSPARSRITGSRQRGSLSLSLSTSPSLVRRGGSQWETRRRGHRREQGTRDAAPPRARWSRGAGAREQPGAGLAPDSRGRTCVARAVPRGPGRSPQLFADQVRRWCLRAPHPSPSLRPAPNQPHPSLSTHEILSFFTASDRCTSLLQSFPNTYYFQSEANFSKLPSEKKKKKIGMIEKYLNLYRMRFQLFCCFTERILSAVYRKSKKSVSKSTQMQHLTKSPFSSRKTIC